MGHEVLILTKSMGVLQEGHGPIILYAPEVNNGNNASISESIVVGVSGQPIN